MGNPSLLTEPRALPLHELLAPLLTRRDQTPGLEPVSLIDLARLGSEGSSRLLALDPVSRSRLLAACELGRRVLEATLPERPKISGPGDVETVLAPRLVEEPVEVFVVLLLDARHRVVAQPTISRGTLTSSLVHPREVFRPALLARAAAVVLAHNHPSGDPAPSVEDDAVTRRMAAAGRLLGVPVLDHVVIARDGSFGYRERRPRALLDEE